MPLDWDVVELMTGACFFDVADPDMSLRPRIRTAVYRLFASDGRLLYVGMSQVPDRRFAAHKYTARWWPLVDEPRTTLEWFATRGRARTRERRAIQSERPEMNIQGALPAETR